LLKNDFRFLFLVYNKVVEGFVIKISENQEKSDFLFQSLRFHTKKIRSILPCG